MKIPQSNTNITIECISEVLTHQGTNMDVESNQIRDKLRKKKQITKQSPKGAQKGLTNGKEKRKQQICSKKSNKSVQQGTSSKPFKKKDFNNMDEQVDTTEGHQRVSSFFQNQLSKYYPNTPVNTKPQQRFTKKATQQHAENLIESYLHELREQQQIKVTGLLVEKEKILFGSSKFFSIPKYEQETMDFFLSIKNKQEKQNCDFYNTTNMTNKLQKRLSLILQTGQIHYSNAFYFCGNSSDSFTDNLQKISLLQRYYLTEAKAFEKVWENNVATKINQPEDLKNIAKILLVLAKCYKSNHKRVHQILQKYQAQQEKILDGLNKPKNIPLPSSFSSNNQFYIKCMIKKCLFKTFSDQQTLFTSDHQFWNHFKLTSHLEQNIIQEGYRDNEKYLPIENEEQYKEYMKRIKNKKIIYKASLNTNCKACFSSHFERYNPIVKCPQCKSRVHKFCAKIEDRCDKCSYKKLGASLKAQTPKCYICLNDSTSLMLHKLKGTKFVHNFCMLAHYLWTVSNDRLTFMVNKKQEIQNEDSTKSLELVKSAESVNSQSRIPRKSIKSTSIIIFDEKEESCQSKSMVDESEQINNFLKRQLSNQSKCKYCNKCSQKQYLKQCKNCKQSVHILCAYLNGCPIEISEWKNNFEINFDIRCCPGNSEQSIEFEEIRVRREMSRKYRLNYERYALNYGFENELKTSKLVESCCNLAQVEEQEGLHVERETLRFEKDHILQEIKDQSIQEC